jgi:hypothetical protein
MIWRTLKALSSSVAASPNEKFSQIPYWYARNSRKGRIVPCVDFHRKAMVVGLPLIMGSFFYVT